MLICLMAEMMQDEPGLDVKRSNDLSVQQLHTFRNVVDQGGYTAAARRSGLSVPTVWQHIQALERLYGVQLFEKIGQASASNRRGPTAV